MEMFNDYNQFRKQFYIGDAIQCKLSAELIEGHNSIMVAADTMTKTFRVSKVFPQMLELVTEYRSKMIKCYVNIKELWIHGKTTTVFITREE